MATVDALTDLQLIEQEYDRTVRQDIELFRDLFATRSGHSELTSEFEVT